MLLCIDIGLAIYCCPEPKKELTKLLILFTIQTHIINTIFRLCVSTILNPIIQVSHCLQCNYKSSNHKQYIKHV